MNSTLSAEDRSIASCNLYASILIMFAANMHGMPVREAPTCGVGASEFAPEVLASFLDTIEDEPEFASDIDHARVFEAALEAPEPETIQAWHNQLSSVAWHLVRSIHPDSIACPFEAGHAPVDRHWFSDMGRAWFAFLGTVREETIIGQYTHAEFPLALHSKLTALCAEHGESPLAWELVRGMRAQNLTLTPRKSYAFGRGPYGVDEKETYERGGGWESGAGAVEALRLYRLARSIESS